MTETENWKQVPGFPGYDVSDQGRFRRWINERTGYKYPGGKLDRMGYVQIGLVKDGKQVWNMAHRLVAAAWLTLPPSTTGVYLTVNHVNRIRHDNRLVNLEIVSMADNQRHWRRVKLHDLAPG